MQGLLLLETIRNKPLETIRNKPLETSQSKIPEAWSFRFCDYVNEKVHVSVTSMTAAVSHFLLNH
jgi:hypothetical protein